ncbi:UDP-N-acetylglucosamine 1-carboxyvinyltransferase [Candidatus Campbellbacteria bacterium]|nr:MAG: UDP-N-acetylglucosamine 1-carboxyvinyltransferase [Candidatus Campbellbacteria bacterium]
MKKINIKIEGGRKLKGKINTNTSKNGAMGLLHAALLNKGKTTLHKIPKTEEVFRVLEIFESIGVLCKWIGEENDVLELTPPKKYNFKNIYAESAVKIRSFLMAIGPLVHHLDNFKIPQAGGCKMGERTISAHKSGLEKLGVKIKVKDDGYYISKDKLKPAEIVMYEASDTATENILICAAGIAGKTTIHFGQQNYMVMDVIYFLKSLGIKIEFLSDKIVVHGKKNINKNIKVYNSEDPVESMFFISAAVSTKSKDFVIRRCPINFLRLEILKMESMGIEFKISKTYLSYNKKTVLADISISKFKKLKALPDKIHALPYPGINIDNLPFFVPICLQAEGKSLIHDWMWEKRIEYFTLLKKTGAKIKLLDKHRIEIEGNKSLKPATINCPPALRPSAAILITLLGINGESRLNDIYNIKRGYADIVERLNSVGAKIEEI